MPWKVWPPGSNSSPMLGARVASAIVPVSLRSYTGAHVRPAFQVVAEPVVL